MKIFVYNYREFDEAEYLKNFQKSIMWSLVSAKRRHRLKMHIL